jgi:hypothetical protein
MGDPELPYVHEASKRGHADQVGAACLFVPFLKDFPVGTDRLFAAFPLLLRGFSWGFGRLVLTLARPPRVFFLRRPSVSLLLLGEGMCDGRQGRCQLC